MIKISFIKKFDPKLGGKALQVTTIKALGIVPKEYTEGYPNCIKHQQALVVNKNKDEKFVIKEGETYREQDLLKVLRIVNQCGNRLRKINTMLKSSWESRKPTAVKI